MVLHVQGATGLLKLQGLDLGCLLLGERLLNCAALAFCQLFLAMVMVLVANDDVLVWKQERAIT